MHHSLQPNLASSATHCFSSVCRCAFRRPIASTGSAAAAAGVADEPPVGAAFGLPNRNESAILLRGCPGGRLSARDADARRSSWNAPLYTNERSPGSAALVDGCQGRNKKINAVTCGMSCCEIRGSGSRSAAAPIRASATAGSAHQEEPPTSAVQARGKGLCIQPQQGNRCTDVRGRDSALPVPISVRITARTLPAHTLTPTASIANA